MLVLRPFYRPIHSFTRRQPPPLTLVILIQVVLGVARLHGVSLPSGLHGRHHNKDAENKAEHGADNKAAYYCSWQFPTHRLSPFHGSDNGCHALFDPWCPRLRFKRRANGFYTAAIGVRLSASITWFPAKPRLKRVPRRPLPPFVVCLRHFFSPFSALAHLHRKFRHAGGLTP